MDYAFKISPNGKYIFSKDQNGSMKQWRINDHFCRDWSKIISNTKLYHFNFNDNGKYLFTSANGRNIRQWDVETGKQVRDWGQILEKHTKRLDASGLILFPKGDYLFQMSSNAYLWQFHIKRALLMKNYGRMQKGTKTLIGFEIFY